MPQDGRVLISIGGFVVTSMLCGLAMSLEQMVIYRLLQGIFGASLFFGDGMITPPITVLGAVEGLEVVSPVFKQWVLPISLVMLTALFAFQRFGTASVGNSGDITASNFGGYYSGYSAYGVFARGALSGKGSTVGISRRSGGVCFGPA